MKSSFTLSYLFVVTTLFLGACRPEDTLPDDKKILTFQFSSLPQAQVRIDDAKQLIEVSVPYNTLINALTPQLSISEGAQVVPASGQVQNFNKAVYYTITAANGTKIIYTVLVKAQAQPQPQIVGFSADTVEAGHALKLTGKYFGDFPLDITVKLLNAKNEGFSVPFDFKDSTAIQLNIPVELSPEQYRVQLSVKNESVVSTRVVYVSYPSPQITALPKRNLLQGDTLWIIGKHLSSKYDFGLLLHANGQQLILPVVAQTPSELGFKTTTSLPIGTFGLTLLNKTENKKSLQNGYLARIYDATQPFVRGIVSPQASYSPGAKVNFSTRNMASSSSRFFQFNLIGNGQSYAQNGIFLANTKQLQLDLPTNAKAGTYSLNVSLIHSSGNILQSIDLDNVLTIK